MGMPIKDNPHFPALQSTPRLRQAGRADALALSGASRRKQIISSRSGCHGACSLTMAMSIESVSPD